MGDLQAGRRTVTALPLEVLDAATTGPDARVVSNRLEVAAYYTGKVAAGCAYGPESTAVSRLASVTAAASTVAATKAAIDSGCAGGGGVELNQHGLTGSWYEAATDGQGVEVEVFPSSSGTGSAFVSWFTYDTVSGDATRQRWYTAQGPVVSGQPTAALTIYQNSGGNFNAPPITTAQAVGSATLSFDSCTSGLLAYSFTDGSGRSGSIPLTRLTQNVTCSSTTPPPTNADFALSGNWYSASTAGQGFTVEVNPNARVFFAAWYTYLPNGTAAGVAGQRWYTAQGAFSPGLRTIPVTLYQTTGGRFDTPTPAGQTTVAVGSGTHDLPELCRGELQLHLHRRQQQRLGRHHRLAPRRPTAARV